MAKYVGLSVLHPGRFDFAKKLIRKCEINTNTCVLDIACGMGTTSIDLLSGIYNMIYKWDNLQKQSSLFYNNESLGNFGYTLKYRICFLIFS